MSPRTDDSSLPIHIGQIIVDGMMDLKQEVGALGGKIDGLQTSVGDLHGRVSQCMTRDECASILHGRRHGTPSAELRKRSDWWDSTQKKIGVIVGLFVILGTVGGAFYWMSGAYDAIQRTRVDINDTTQKAADRAAERAAQAAREANEAAVKAAAKAVADAAKEALKDRRR